MSQFFNLLIKGLTKRQIFLVVTLLGLALAVLKLGLDPKAANRQPQNLTFPASVPVPPWQFMQSAAIAPNNPKLEEFFLDIYEYKYQKEGKSLNVKMYYTLGTRGESSVFLAKRFEIDSAVFPIAQEFRGNSETGYYSLFNYKGRSHLVSCINPRGSSTVTSQQFLANRNQYDLQPERFIPWILGQEALRDNRCLWVDMSIPLEAKTAYPILEKAWGSWYQYWDGKFPSI